MSKKFGNRFLGNKFSSMREKFTLSRERKTSQSLKVRSLHNEKQKLNSSLPDISGLETSTKYYLFTDGDVQIHLLGKGSTGVFSDLMQSIGSIRSWENHHIHLNDDGISSENPSGILATQIPYTSIEQVLSVDFAKGPNSYLKITTNTKSYLFQAPDAYQRDRLLTSIIWRMAVHKSTGTLYAATQPEAMVLELESLVSMTLGSMLYVDDTHRVLLDVASKLLTQKADLLSGISRENLIAALGPLVEQHQPSTEICTFFTKHFRQCPRSVIVVNKFTSIVQQILKHTVDFGKSTCLRDFIMEYILALNSQNNGLEAVKSFIQSMHGPLSQCPHPRILNNLIAVCLSAIYQYFSNGEDDYDKRRQRKFDSTNYKGRSVRKQQRHQMASLHEKTSVMTEKNILNNERSSGDRSDAKNLKNSVQESLNRQLLKDSNAPDDAKPLNTELNKRSDVNLKEYYSERDKKPAGPDQHHTAPEISEENFANASLFVKVLLEISKLYDWRPGLAGLLQPLPFPDEAMRRKEFIRLMYPVVEHFAEDDRESVVTCLLYSREGKDGWVQVFSPGGARCEDDGLLFSKMVGALMTPGIQTGKMKKFLTMLSSTHIQVIIMLALRENPVMIKVLRDMLQFGILKQEQEQLQVVSALRCTPTGNTAYEELRSLLSVFSQNDGPKEFTLAPNSTDADLTTLLGTGSWGNLEKLDLSFTHITSETAQLLAMLPNLKHLNLWSTNFDDSGLQWLCDSVNLTSLNLCETHVSDNGIGCLEAMSNLERLNLNSTRVSSDTFLHLQKSLPNLRDWDVTYTEAWFGLDN